MSGPRPQILDLEQELHQMGIPIGERVLELTFNREKGSSTATSGGRREIGLVNMLHHLSGTVWKTLFGKAADGLEQSNHDESEYWILDKAPITNIFTSVGKRAQTQNMGGHNCAFFIAGIVEGFLCGANLHAKVLPVLHAPTQTHDVSETTTNNYE